VRETTTHAVRTTIVGGLLFLVPFVLVVAIAGKGYQVMRAMARPIADALGIDRLGFVAVIDLFTLLLTLALCYAAGLVATSERGRRAYQALDTRLLDIWPRYAFIKATASGVARKRVEHMRPVMVRFDDQSQLAFEVERDQTRVVVFLPGSPDPWSGAVSFVDGARVTPLDVDVQSVLKALRGGGRGGLALPSTGCTGVAPRAGA
jgi:uncharacterized membrane protein